MTNPSRRAILALPLLAAPALAQERPLRLVVASAAGANADVVARLLAAELEAVAARRVLVENIPAVSGLRAVEAVGRTEGDGETLLLATPSQLVFAPALMDAPPVDPFRVLRALAMVNVVPMALCVPADGPADLPALLGRLRLNGPAQYGSGPTGTTTHVTGAGFVRAAELHRVDLVHVPYQSSALALTDLMAGRLTFMFDAAITALPHHRSGRLRILGVAAERRLPAAPELPTLDEAGLPGFTGSTWNSLAVPAGTPDAVVARLAAQVGEALARPALRRRLAEMGSELPEATMPPAAVAAFWEEERRRWVPLLRP